MPTTPPKYKREEGEIFARLVNVHCLATNKKQLSLNGDVLFS